MIIMINNDNNHDYFLFLAQNKYDNENTKFFKVRKVSISREIFFRIKTMFLGVYW